MTFFFDFSGENENGGDVKVASLVTYSDQDIRERTKKLQGFGASCRFQKLPTGNYLFALDGMLLSDLDGLTPGSLGHILDAMIAHRKPGAPKSLPEAVDNAAILKGAVEERKTLSAGLYKEWKERMKKAEKASSGCDPALLATFIRDICVAAGLPADEAMSNLDDNIRAFQMPGSSPSDAGLFADGPSKAADFKRIAAAGVIDCLQTIGKTISNETANRIFPMIQESFAAWWKTSVEKELSGWENGQPPYRYSSWESKNIAFEDWVHSSFHRIRTSFRAPSSLALIMESLGPAYSVVEATLASFRGSITQMSPLEWRVASCLMQLEQMKR